VLGASNVQVTIDKSVSLPDTTVKAEKPKATKATAAVAPAPVAPITAPVTAPAASTGFDFKKIEEVIPKALEAAGRGKVLTLLEKYGAKKGSELKASDYEAFYNECQALVTASSLT
jgi:hypothetical protein